VDGNLPLKARPEINALTRSKISEPYQGVKVIEFDHLSPDGPLVAGARPHARDPPLITWARVRFMEPDAACQAIRPRFACVAQLEAGAAHHRPLPERGTGGTGNAVVPLRSRPLPARRSVNAAPKYCCVRAPGGAKIRNSCVKEPCFGLCGGVIFQAWAVNQHTCRVHCIDPSPISYREHEGTSMHDLRTWEGYPDNPGTSGWHWIEDADGLRPLLWRGQDWPDEMDRGEWQDGYAVLSTRDLYQIPLTKTCRLGAPCHRTESQR